MPQLVWVKAEGANDAEAFRVEIDSTTNLSSGFASAVSHTVDPTAAQQPSTATTEQQTSTTTSSWWLNASQPVIGDILDAAVKLFFPARAASGRQHNIRAFELWLQKRRLTDFTQSASDVIESALKRALDVTPTVSNRSGTIDQFMLLRRQGVVFELRLPASPFSNARRPAQSKHSHFENRSQQQQQRCVGRRSSAGAASPPRSSTRAASRRDSGAVSPTRSPPDANSSRTSEHSGDTLKAPPALTPLPVSATGAAMWIPKATADKFFPGKACNKFSPRWGVPKVCDVCFEHISSHASCTQVTAGGGSPSPVVGGEGMFQSPLSKGHHVLPTTPRTPLHMATPRLGAADGSFGSPYGARPLAAVAESSAARSVYTKTCQHFIPLWDRNDHCSTCYRPVHWHDEYLHDLALKRRRFVMTLRQHHNSEHHQKLMALLPWHHVFHFLSVEDILSCACVSRVCSLTARVLLKSIMGLVVKYEAPGDMRMRILRDADRIATSLDASKTLSFASIYSTKVLIALVEVCRGDGSGDISADKIAGGSTTANHLAARTALLLAFHESHSNKDSTDNSSSKSLIPPPAIVPRRGSGSKRRSSTGKKHNTSAVSSNNSNESSPLAQGDANNATDSATGYAANDASSRISSIVEVIHTILQIEPEDLTTAALDAIRDIPQSPGRGGKQRSLGPTISFRDHLLSTYGDHQSTSPRYGRISSTAPTEDDVDDAHQSVLRPLVNYLLTLAHLHRMKVQARRYLEQPFLSL
jgi:hypothetical protein